MVEADTISQIASLLTPAVLTIIGVRTTLTDLSAKVVNLSAELATLKVDLADLRARYALNHPPT